MGWKVLVGAFVSSLVLWGTIIGGAAAVWNGVQTYQRTQNFEVALVWNTFFGD